MEAGARLGTGSKRDLITDDKAEVMMKYICTVKIRVYPLYFHLVHPERMLVELVNSAVFSLGVYRYSWARKLIM
jgi:hypothetical protein